MVYRSSFSAGALLAFLTACLASVQQGAMAGDKIEFSAPPDSLAVPRPERAVLPDSGATIRDTLSHHQAEGADFTTGPSVTIIVPAAKSHDHFGWTAPFEENQEQDADSGLDLFAPRKTAATHTNSWNISSDHDSVFSRDRDRSWNKEGNWMQPDGGLLRFGADSASRPGESGEDWLSRRFDQRSAPDWSRSMASEDPKEYERMRKEGFTQAKEDFSTYYNQPAGGLPRTEFGSAAELSRGLGSTDGVLGNAWRDDGLRGQSEQQVMMQPAVAQAQALEELPTPSHPVRRSSWRDQTFESPSHVPYAPATLPFPKRPGDLFQ